MILAIKAKELDNTDRLYEKLLEDFNKIAKENHSSFRLIRGESLTLVKPFLLGIGNSLGECHIVYNMYENQFEFSGGIDEETFNEVKPILDKLKQEFKIELI